MTSYLRCLWMSLYSVFLTCYIRLVVCVSLMSAWIRLIIVCSEFCGLRSTVGGAVRQGGIFLNRERPRRSLRWLLVSCAVGNCFRRRRRTRLLNARPEEGAAGYGRPAGNNLLPHEGLFLFIAVSLKKIWTVDRKRSRVEERSLTKDYDLRVFMHKSYVDITFRAHS